MTDAELFQFLDVFKSLVKVFPKRIGEDDLQQLGASYFKAMRRFSVDQVAAGAEIWVQRGKFFPKPAEWIEAIPRVNRPRVEMPKMDPAAAQEYEDAERRHYNGDPCKCGSCRAAGVDHRFLRFVPEVDDLGRDAKARIGDRVVVTGHWAHGAELARWYASKEAFFAVFDRGVMAHTMPAVDLGPVTADVPLDYTDRLLGET